MADNRNNGDLANVLASLIEAVNTNTNVIEEYITDTQENTQVQGTTDRTNIRDIGNNTVNVINYIDPDTLSGAVANNESLVANLAAAVADAVAAALAVELQRILEQNGLINIGVQ